MNRLASLIHKIAVFVPLYVSILCVGNHALGMVVIVIPKSTSDCIADSIFILNNNNKIQAIAWQFDLSELGLVQRVSEILKITNLLTCQNAVPAVPPANVKSDCIHKPQRRINRAENTYVSTQKSDNSGLSPSVTQSNATLDSGTIFDFANLRTRRGDNCTARLFVLNPLLSDYTISLKCGLALLCQIANFKDSEEHQGNCSGRNNAIRVASANPLADSSDATGKAPSGPDQELSYAKNQEVNNVSKWFHWCLRNRWLTWMSLLAGYVAMDRVFSTHKRIDIAQEKKDEKCGLWLLASISLVLFFCLSITTV